MKNEKIYMGFYIPKIGQFGQTNMTSIFQYLQKDYLVLARFIYLLKNCSLYGLNKKYKNVLFALFICANTPSQLLWVFMKTYGCQDTFVKFYEIIAWSIRFRPFIIKWP